MKNDDKRFRDLLLGPIDQVPEEVPADADEWTRWAIEQRRGEARRVKPTEPLPETREELSSEAEATEESPRRLPLWTLLPWALVTLWLVGTLGHGWGIVLVSGLLWWWYLPLRQKYFANQLRRGGSCAMIGA